MSELTIHVSKSNNIVVLHLHGHLHGPTEQVLLDHAREAHTNGSRNILLDLSNIEVLSSAGLRGLHVIFKLFTPEEDIALIRKHGDDPYKSPYFKLVCPDAHLYYTLNITGFTQNMLIYNNVEEAVKSFA